ncbi:MAG TPA: hypothetical protein VFX24_11455, partial [Ktedonobacterales bacterium]|nr:hypothetical protein [Ktedonobacterales bacterium]
DMGFFRWLQGQSSSRHALPRDIVSMMERYGRFEYDPQGSGEDAGSIWSQTQSPLRPFATEDLSGFLAALATAVLPVGGWAVFGAERTMWNLISSPNREDPSYNAIMDASLAFLRTLDRSQGHVTGYEWQHWVANGGTHENW